jgi:hypothetical protein
MSTIRTLLVVISLCSCLSVLGSAQATSVCKDGKGNATACNGVSVGLPKVFDNRSLTLKLEDLDKTLKAQQAANSFINFKAVAAAINNVQGLSQTETDTSLSVVGNPTPSRSVTTDIKTGNVDSSGNPLPNSTDRQTQTNQASITPQSPPLDSFGSLPAGFNPSFGNSASDLLNDQVNLSYQITNLQMLIERSLSDRLDTDDSIECDKSSPKICNETRLQTVLGFNVTLDPPRTANDAVAVVEITLKCAEAAKCQGIGAENISLVALMPQEKTYNAATLSSKSNAFSGAAVAGAFQVSGGVRHRSQTFYVYKDTDTLSYQRMTADGDLVFGWMFRPVLGRRSVAPGLRQLFAVVSLPNVDCYKRDAGCTAKLRPSIRTYWKKYSRGTQTSFESRDANRATKFWYGLSLELAKPQLFADPPPYLNTAEYPEISVRSTFEYQQALTPIVRRATWHATGEKTAIISVEGNNFFTGTQVMLGDKAYSEDNKNLTIKSNQALELSATLDQLVNGPAAIIGRYGLSAPITQIGDPACTQNSGAATVSCVARYGIEIVSARMTEPISGNRRVEIHLKQRLTPEMLQALVQSAAVLANAKATEEQGKEVLRKEEVKIDQLRQSAATSGKRRPLSQTLKLKEEITEALSERNKLSEDLSKMAYIVKASQDAYEKAERASWLDPTELPRFPAESLTAQESQAAATLVGSPLISVNGTTLELPYETLDNPQTHETILAANLPDSLLTAGGGLIKVTWPFYSPDRWTSSYFRGSPDGQFKVTRVSDKSVVISRLGGFSFAQDAPEDFGDHCWKFIAGDQPIQLATSSCPYRPPPPAKGGDAEKGDKKGTRPLVEQRTYTTSATAGEKLPGQALLLAPNGTVYTLTIPDLAAKKDDAAKPTTLSQNDATWVDIVIPAGKVPFHVEANGSALTWRFDAADPKSKVDPKKPQTIHVEVTRLLTLKSGSVDLTVLDAKNQQIAKQQVKIACSQCSDKGEK